MTHFDQAVTAWDKSNESILSFGYHAMKAVDDEGKTIRDLSVKLCGNDGLEDKIGRYIMAARWLDAISQNRKYNPMLEDLREWMTPGHFTELWKIAQQDAEKAFDSMEQCFVRNLRTEITEVKPVDWLRGKRATDKTPEEMFRKVWTWASRALPDAFSVLERKGLEATKEDKWRVRLLQLVIKYFEVTE